MTIQRPYPSELASDLKVISTLELAYGLTKSPSDIPARCSDDSALHADAMSHQSRRLIMKTIFTSLAAVALLATSAFATPVMAQEIDLSDRNDGLTKLVICSNVPAASGSVSGFLIPTVGYFVSEAGAAYATVDAEIVPAEYDVKDGADVAAYLQSIGLTNFELAINTSDTETKLVSVEVSPGVFELQERDVRVFIPAYRQRFCG